MSAKKTPNGRTIATTQLVAGRIAIGQQITISTITDTHPRRTQYTGQVYAIFTDATGRDQASIAVLGDPRPITFQLEPIGS